MRANQDPKLFLGEKKSVWMGEKKSLTFWLIKDASKEEMNFLTFSSFIFPTFSSSPRHHSKEGERLRSLFDGITAREKELEGGGRVAMQATIIWAIKLSW